MSYIGETAYVTGGASGIGRSLVTALVGKGMKVFVADRNLKGAEEVASALNRSTQVAWPVQVDVADWESQRQGFEAAVKELGRIDYVFAVAGITEVPWTRNRPDATDFEKPNLSVWDVNGTGALYTSSLAIQQFRRQEPNKHGFRGKGTPDSGHGIGASADTGSKVLIVASACGFYYMPLLPIYTASKHAIVGFVRSYGKYLTEEKITLNAICPTIVKTGISSGAFYDKADAKGLLVTLESLVDSFEALLGADTTTGEAIEVLPGDEGHRIKERAEYTTDKCKQSVEMTIERSRQAAAFNQPVKN
ncbi:15-hydroxyprostaglandin dehydrogenase [Fusarium albosuccineum]|uniref:15-hydroxyprostaglandin dehydrogenase n=1 Tax=Fusarium albosuccineum TaxID=1237068 RepID=A0A8H4PKJ1_9HYPO|nr:15-hydroxyprostaglandin dehydrogenase [Fusarium albosuccineum]